MHVGAFRNVRIEPFDILGKMCHAQMVFTRTHLVPQAISATQQLVGIAHDLELLVNIFQPARTVQMILFAALYQQRMRRDERGNIAHVE